MLKYAIERAFGREGRPAVYAGQLPWRLLSSVKSTLACSSVQGMAWTEDGKRSVCGGPGRAATAPGVVVKSVGPMSIRYHKVGFGSLGLGTQTPAAGRTSKGNPAIAASCYAPAAAIARLTLSASAELISSCNSLSERVEGVVD
jgi:hypothetical protein